MAHACAKFRNLNAAGATAPLNALCISDRGCSASNTCLRQTHLCPTTCHRCKSSIDVDAPCSLGVVAALVSVDLAYTRHVLCRQAKVADGNVLADPVGLSALGYHNRLPLQAPPQNDLAGGLVVFLRQLLDKQDASCQRRQRTAAG